MEGDEDIVEEPIYANSRPHPGLPEAPAAVVRIRRDMPAGFVPRTIRWLITRIAGNERDSESAQFARVARVHFWITQHQTMLAWAALAAAVAVLGVAIAWYGREYLSSDTEVITMPCGTVLYAALRADEVFLRPKGDTAIANLSRRVVNSSAIDRAALERGYYESGWRGGPVNVTIERLDAAIRSAPAHLCVTATRLGLDGHAVRPPHHADVLYMPAGRPGASNAVEIRPWPTDDVLDPYVRDAPAQLYSPREQYFGYYNRHGVVSEVRLSGTAVACVKYAEELLLRVGRAAT